jgi:hypothetical protein
MVIWLDTLRESVLLMGIFAPWYNKKDSSC